MVIRFNFQKKIVLNNRRALKQFLKGIFEREGKKLRTLDYVFCDDSQILNVNKTFLKHDYYTDIITFNMTEPEASSLIGEIYISADTVASNALKYKASFEHELYRVMIHGVLHLCGFMDKTKIDKKRMRQKENFYLKGFYASL